MGEPKPVPEIRYLKLIALIAGSQPFQQEGNFIICTEQEIDPDVYYNEEHNVRLSYKADSPSRWVIEHPSQYFNIFIAGKVELQKQTPEGVYQDVGGETNYIDVSFTTAPPQEKSKKWMFFNSFNSSSVKK